MKKKEKVIIFIAVVCMMLTVIFGYSYAYWTIRKEQTGMNQIASACLNIEFEEDNDIELKQAFPILDKDGEQLVPYTFTIRNTCDTYANYQINLETFDVASGKTRMYDSYIKANLKKGEGRKFNGTLTNDIEVTPTISGATNAYKLATGTLKNGNTHTYNLRVWMDQSVTMEDENAMNSSFAGKISVVFTAAVDPFAEAGTLKRAPGIYNTITEFWSYKNNITEVEFQNKMEPIADAIENWDVSATNDGSVMAYMINKGTDASPEYKIYIQGNSGVKANPDSSYLFSDFKKITKIKGLEYFDTSNVTSMSSMFENCYKLEELDLSGFDTSNVTNMSHMFYMFTGSNLIELNLSNWDTSNVTSMSSMFYRCSKLESLDVSHFDTSNVTSMYGLFEYCSSLMNLDVSNFDTSNVTNMSSIFEACSKLETLNVSNFDTSNVTNMSFMFSSCNNLIELNLSNFDTSNVTDMSGMLEMCYKLTNLDLSNFDTSNVINMRWIFSKDIRLETIVGLENFDTSNVTNMALIFNECRELKDIRVSAWDTSKVKDMDHIFYSCYRLKSLDLSHWDTSNVTNMSCMFSNSGIENLDLTGWNTSNVTDMSWMFDSIKLTSLDVSSFDTSNVTSMRNMFSSCSKLTEIDVSHFDTSKVIDMGGMFDYFKGQIIGIENFNTINVTYFTNTWNDTNHSGFLKNASNVNITINIKTQNVSDYREMFLNAATESGSQIIVNYTSDNEELVDAMIATKSDNSNVVKGSLITEYDINIDNSYSSLVNLSSTSAYSGKTITLTPIQSNKAITSFKVNGTLVNGDSFTMPNENVTITDVNIVEAYTIESEHNPYENNINNEVYYENTFENATSITVKLTYQTESTSYDWVYLYTSPSTIYQNKKYGGTTLKTETVTYNGNYIKLTFRTNASGNNYYGFKAIIIPNYD